MIPFYATVIRPYAWTMELPMQEMTQSELNDLQGGEGTGAHAL